ncbi:MAG: hypothetical protein KBT88_13240 [Gammaproteobacteria bacterium]|nr:hypothetical protein [Gammaproteobacteria bacterium]MBQ0840742.1 hypothetical protein [Gammaproteobacteria bacterium]
MAGLVMASLLLSACATQVEVDGNFPPALTHQLPVKAVVVFEPAFASHRFVSSEGQKVSIAVGQIQVELFSGLADSLFEHSSTTTSMPAKPEADLILLPTVEDVQISMPNESQLKVFEVWIKYNLQVFNSAGEPVADWIMTAYGKTPTRFLKSSTEALHQAAMVAMRDAGAHFITGFARVPEVRQWLQTNQTRVSSSNPSSSNMRAEQ